MVMKPGRLTAAAAFAAMLAMPATNAAAADLARVRPAAVKAYDAGLDSANGWRRHHRRDGLDAGDVIAGVLMLGGIAAIASAASRSRNDRPDRYPDDARYPQDARYPDSRYPDDARSRLPGRDRPESSGLARAVDMCVDQIERGRERVSNVDNATRDSRGWQVSGDLVGGEHFTCRIGNDGRIDDLSVGSPYDAAYSGTVDRQYSDETYARLRAEQADAVPYSPGYEAQADEDVYGDDPRPAYPGGPLPGEDGYDESVASSDYAPVG